MDGDGRCDRLGVELGVRVILHECLNQRLVACILQFQLLNSADEGTDLIGLNSNGIPPAAATCALLEFFNPRLESLVLCGDLLELGFDLLCVRKIRLDKVCELLPRARLEVQLQLASSTSTLGISSLGSRRWLLCI